MSYNESQYQADTVMWVQSAFGNELTYNRAERAHRFLEEAIELYQAMGQDEGNALALVKYVYGRPTGVVEQEIGGVMVTLAALCHSIKFDMLRAGQKELHRCWHNISKIRAKAASKRNNSALPGAYGNAGRSLSEADAATAGMSSRSGEIALPGDGKP